MQLSEMPQHSVIKTANELFYIRHEWGWQNINVYWDILDEEEFGDAEFEIVSLPVKDTTKELLDDFSPEVRNKALSVVAFAETELNIHLTEWQYRLVASMIENPHKTIEMRTGRKGPYWALVEKEAHG